MNDSENSRLNNFDFIRIVAAFLVLISHQYALSGLAEPVLFGGTSMGAFGVLIFFSISGFLVSQSWRQDPHIARFLAKRFLRIWPGLATVTLIAAIVLGPVVSTLDWHTYFLKPEFMEFFRNLKIMSIRYLLPGVFEENIFPKAVNGSLWTIPLEVRCYLALLVIGSIGLTKRPILVLLGSISFGIYYFYFSPDPQNYQQHYGLYFLAGVCLDLFRNKWEANPKYLIAAAGMLSIAFYLLKADRVALLIWLPALVTLIGSRSTPILNKAGKYGDISYGLYIYAFPVQQTVLWAAARDFPFFLGLLIAAVITTLCAFLSWHLVEGPALGLKARLFGNIRSNFSVEDAHKTTRRATEGP